MIIIFFDLSIIAIICFFILVAIGDSVSSIFDALPLYINYIILALSGVQIIKQFLVYRYVETNEVESKNISKGVLCVGGCLNV